MRIMDIKRLLVEPVCESSDPPAPKSLCWVPILNTHYVHCNSFETEAVSL